MSYGCNISYMLFKYGHGIRIWGQVECRITEFGDRELGSHYLSVGVFSMVAFLSP